MPGYRILIVDSETGARADLRLHLETAGCCVVGDARSGVEAAELAIAQRPDVSIIDFALVAAGLENGENLVERLGGAVLVALDSDSNIDLHVPAGIAGCIGRPYQKAPTLASIEIAVARQREMAQLADEVSDLRDKLETRRLVDRAKRLLMEMHEIPEEEAFRRVQQQSMNSRTSMRSVAEAIIASHSK